MRAVEFLIESKVTLNPNDLTKHGPDRLNRLIFMIQKNLPLYKVDGTPVTIKKSESKRIKDLYDTKKFRGSISLLGTDGKTYPLNNFLKTSDFGGQSVPPDPNSKIVSNPDLKAGITFSHGAVKKGQTLTPELAINLGAFPAGQLGRKIITNKYLDSQGQAGKYIKKTAKDIDNKIIPTIPKLSKTELSMIQNYGFEYLGVQQLIQGIASFPNSKDFYNHVGVNLEELILYFPKTASNPLTDSFALVNKATENTIGISSKGEKGGAPSSIVGLKIPDNMLKMINKDPAITFINLIQETEKWQQPFVAVNWIKEKYPGKLGKLEPFLPFDDAFFNWAGQTWNNRKNGVPTTLQEIPVKYRKLYKLVQDSVNKTKPVALFFDLRYYVKDILHSAIRGGVIPQFNKRMLELLGQNFILLQTDRSGKPGVGQFITSVHWPSKIGGTVTFEHKDPAEKWTSSITWKLNK